MKKSHFTGSQILDELKRAEAGVTVPELYRELGISSATLFKWMAKFGGMSTSLMACMNELKAEKRRLRKMYVEEKAQGRPSTAMRFGQWTSCMSSWKIDHWSDLDEVREFAKQWM